MRLRFPAATIHYRVGDFMVPLELPHPLSFSTWKELASRCRFRDTSLLAAVPSRFLGQIYAALSYKGWEGGNS